MWITVINIYERDRERENMTISQNLPLNTLMWRKSKAPPILHDISSDSHVLCVQVGPSQPSLQMHLKASAPPTHVPPFSQGPESHVLFWAKKHKIFGNAFILTGSQKESSSRSRVSIFPAERVSAWPVLQVLPPQPEGQLHRKESPWSKHVPPLLQVVGSHWLSPEPRNTTSVFKQQRSGLIHFTLTAKTS